MLSVLRLCGIFSLFGIIANYVKSIKLCLIFSKYEKAVSIIVDSYYPKLLCVGSDAYCSGNCP